jgi:hypothetical protein
MTRKNGNAPKRMDVLWLKSQGLPHREICRLTGVSSIVILFDNRIYERQEIKLMSVGSVY